MKSKSMPDHEMTRSEAAEYFNVPQDTLIYKELPLWYDPKSEDIVFAKEDLEEKDQ